jgi:hypothetical protein
MDDMVGRQQRSEHLSLGIRQKLELGVSSAVPADRPAQALQLVDGLASTAHLRQGFQVPPVGLVPDLEVSLDVADSLVHRPPLPQRFPVRLLDHPQDLKPAMSG